MKKKLSYNILFSLLLQIVAVINSFITSKITINYFGSEINGLVSSINQFLNYISLLEGGVGAVIMAQLYKPIYENDKNKISDIISSSKKFFRQIICIYMIYTLILSLIYPLMIKSSINKESIVTLIWILSISLCAQYFFAISYKILLQASHKLYICSIAQIIAYVVNISLVIISSVKYNNILIVKLFSSIAFLLQPLLYTLFTEKRYRKCYSKGKYELKGRWDGFFQNLAFFINNNTDIVLITLLLNLNEVSVYSVYMLVINGMKSVVLSIYTGFQSILGRKLAQQNTVKIKEFMKKYFYFILIVSLIGFGTIILLIRQFVCIYIGNNSDYSYDRVIFPFIIAISQMIICIREPFNLLIISANKFKETNKGAAIEAILNIVISLFFIKKCGLVGVAVGTLIASLYRLCYFYMYLCKNIIMLNYKIIFKPLFLLVSYISIIALYYFKIDNYNVENWMYFFKNAIFIIAINVVVLFILIIIIFGADIIKLWKKRQ